MSVFVLDASVSTSWLLDDELDPVAEGAFERISQDGVLVPQLWHLEVRNALITAERRRRIDARGLDQRIRAIVELPVGTDTTPNLDIALALARTHKLSFYDAIYLELALRSDSPLATLDGGLAEAATMERVPLVR